MSVQIILSSRQIQLDQYNQAVLNLKAIFAALPPAIVALYKVRTNSKDMVDVRPSFGLLNSRTPEDAIGSMQIKYMGSPESLKKMKLQISWVWGEGIPSRKLTHSEFSEMYANLKEKIGKQKNHMLFFTTKDQAKKGQDSLIFHNQSKSSEGSIPEEPEKEEEGMAEAYSEQPTATLTHNNNGKSVGLKWVIVAILTAFLVGILVGMKIQKARDGVSAQIKQGIVTEQSIGYKDGQKTHQRLFEVTVSAQKQRQQDDHEDINL